MHRVCVSWLGPESAVGTAHFGHFGSLLFCHFRKTFVGVERKRLSVAVMIQTKAGTQDVGECGKGQRWRPGRGQGGADVSGFDASLKYCSERGTVITLTTRLLVFLRRPATGGYKLLPLQPADPLCAERVMEVIPEISGPPLPDEKRRCVSSRSRCCALFAIISPA